MDLMQELSEFVSDANLPSEMPFDDTDDLSTRSSDGTNSPPMSQGDVIVEENVENSDDEKIRILFDKRDVDDFFHHESFANTLEKYDVHKDVKDYVKYKYSLIQLSFREKLNVLNGDLSLQNLFTLLSKNHFKNVIACVGAGISVSCGIPDFRSPGSGLFHNLQKYNVPTPESIFEINYFKSNPKAFYKLSKEIYPTNFKPSLTHKFLKVLSDRGILRRIYTQNIDGLERIAGIPGEKLVEAHGTFNTNQCIKCKTSYSKEFYYNDCVSQDLDPICQVDGCGGYVKPDIVFYGEDLPNRFYALREEDFSKCDLLLVMGTSLGVQPFAGLVNCVALTTPRVLVNRETVGFFRFANRCPLENYRDIITLQDTDSFARHAYTALGMQYEIPDIVHPQPDFEFMAPKPVIQMQPRINIAKSVVLPKVLSTPLKPHMKVPSRQVTPLSKTKGPSSPLSAIKKQKIEGLLKSHPEILRVIQEHKGNTPRK